ncbi:putative ribonuclease H-like domain-containing protein [Tanacetum coccineum]
MQEELLQFKLKQVWTLVDLPYGKRAIGTKWVYRNKKDERGIVIRNKARLVAQGHTQEEGIDYHEVFAPIARIEVIRLFLAYALFKDFVVYQMDVKSAFLYGKIEEEVYVCQTLGFEDPEFPNKVYKVEKALYGLHQAPRAFYETLSTYLLDNGFQRGQIDKTLFIKRIKSDILLVQVFVDYIIFGFTKKELCTDFEKFMHKKFQMSSIGELTFFLGLQVTQKDDGIFISQDKYVDEILKKFSFSTVKTASTPIETSKTLLKDAEAEDVDVHLYRSMIGSLMYLTASMPDITFAVCACARFQVTPKVSHLYAVKKIFRFLKGNPQQEVLWIQNQMLDYGYNFMNTKIHIDNESTICIVKNPMFHSKTKHIEIRHHFIRDSNEKKLIQMTKIHTDHNVTDLLTKAFDVGRFQYLIATANDEIQVSTVGLPYYCKRIDFITDFKQLSLMEALKFVDSHNMVAYLEKSIENADFDEIVDFLNANPIRYALTYATPSHTKKVFANMRRQGKDFSGTVTPLFATMLIQPQADVGEGSGQPTEPQHTPTTASPSNIEPIPIIASSSQPQKTHKHRKTKRPTEISYLDAEQDMVLGPSRQDPYWGDRPAQTRVLALEKAKTAQDLKITTLKNRVKKLEKKRKARTPQLKRRLFKVRIESSADKSLGDQEDVLIKYNA